jgi:DNA (cytosine-5)-methyltransferase 1
MTAYYNETDPYAAQWLRNLIAAGEIAPGDVDERSIVDVRANDLRGYTQAHFFAGIGGWSVALRLAGWPDERPVWSGSCPCQPFSSAGAGKAGDDERHLWPAWASLIAECRPGTVFGEQVEAAIGWGWLDLVFADLEAEGYACGSAVLPACGVGAPHIRNRVWFVADAEPQLDGSGARGEGWRVQSTDGSAARLVADADGGDAGAEGLQRSGEHRREPQDGGAGLVADASRGRRSDEHDGNGPPGQHVGAVAGASFGNGGGADPTRDREAATGNAGAARVRRLVDADAAGSGKLGSGRLLDGERATQRHDADRRSEPSRLAHTECDGGRADEPLWQAQGREADGRAGFWSDALWLPCTDGKARPVKPGIEPLAHGVQRRPSKLRAYGNAIVPQVAAAFIDAFLDERRAA